MLGTEKTFLFILHIREKQMKEENNGQLREIIDKLIEDIKKYGLVIFAGAGISVPAPCSCPTWMELKNKILENFLEKLIIEDWPKKSFLEQSKTRVTDMRLRPETFMWVLNTYIGNYQTLNMINGINLSSPNPNHKLITFLSNIGVIKNIITPNFDTYIEKSLEIGNTKYKPVISDSELRDCLEYPTKDLLVFKPHGCLSKPSSMAYTIDQIQKLPDDKMKLLKHILLSAPVLIIGYSGNDEDIFPIICSTLIESRFKTYICIYPRSPKNEPIQEWDIKNLNQIYKFNADPMLILESLANTFRNKKIGDILIHNSNETAREDNVWEKSILSCIEGIAHDIIALTIGNLWYWQGNYNRALSFANLAEDICIDTKLSRSPRESLLMILELQSRIHKESETANLRADALQGSILKESLEGNNFQEVINALLGRAHVALRNNNLASAERDLDLVGAHLLNEKKLRGEGLKNPEDASNTDILFLWYSGILKRKQENAQDADALFNQALAITLSKKDIITTGRIFLDYGYVKCQMDDWETAQQIWGLSSDLAERANDWDTAAKAAKNRGLLLSVSDKPYLGKPELERSKMLFERAGNYEGVKRVETTLGYSHEEFILCLMSLKKPLVSDEEKLN